MEILVRGRNFTVPAQLRTDAQEKVEKISRFARDVTRVEVDFARVHHRSDGDSLECEITAHLKRHFVKAHVHAREPEEALDLAIAKVEHQVAKIKERRVSRSHPRHKRSPRTNGERGFEPIDGDDGDDEAEQADGAIVRTKQFTMKPMGPEEAALQMELLGHDFYLFTNAESGNAAVLYRRRDGALGLIEAVG